MKRICLLLLALAMLLCACGRTIPTPEESAEEPSLPSPDADGNKTVWYDTLETETVSLTEAQYAFFSELLLNAAMYFTK